MANLLRAVAAAGGACAILLGASTPSSAQDAQGPALATEMLAVATPIATIRAWPDLGTPELAAAAAQSAAQTKDGSAKDAPSAATLAALVARHEDSDAVGDEHECLAKAVYFESRGEPLEGQLAVAQVILNRAASGRFAKSACGVVRQKSQFSFVHHGALPVVRSAGADWRRAVAIAEIARDRLWKPMVRDALYFGCGSEGRTRIAALGRHVFYR